MLKVVLGPKGTGKTQHVIELVNEAISEDTGSVICIELGNRLTYDISHKARLIDIADYPLDGFPMLRGFLSGLCAGNYDISHIFIDSLYKVSNSKDPAETDAFLTWLDDFAGEKKINVSVMISIPMEEATEAMKKYAE